MPEEIFESVSLENADTFHALVLSALAMKSWSNLTICLDHYESSDRVVLCWKSLTRTRDFMDIMKNLFDSDLFRSLFFRFLILFLKFLGSSAEKNESERNELLSIKSKIEFQIEEFFLSDYFDDAANVMDLLFLDKQIKSQNIFNGS